MRRHIRAGLFALLCLVQAPGLVLEAQSVGVVRGRVVTAGGAPAVRVKVTILTQWTYTDSTGRYLLARVPFGKHRMTLERGGRKMTSQEIVVQAPVTDVPDLRW